MTARIHHQHVSARFSAAAQTYTGASNLQDRVARRVLDLVPENIFPENILDAGCGPGRLMSFARQRWPDACMTGVDIAPGMVSESQSLFCNDRRTAFVVNDIASFQVDQPFDLVLSSSALHWLRPFNEGIAHVAGLCRRGGLMAIGIMLDGTLNELRTARNAVAPHKAAPGRLPTLNELEQAAHLVPCSRIRRIEQSTAEYDQASAADVLRSVHDMGVTGGDVSRGQSPLTRGEMRALTEYYDKNFATSEGVRVTFVVGYLLLECGV